MMLGIHCLCGAKIEEGHTGGYTCPKCFRSYSVKGKLIGNNQWIEFFDMAKKKDDMTMQYDEDNQ